MREGAGSRDAAVIEDGLSSIRRLVPADEHDKSAEAQEEAAVSEKDDKLVLTSAQRVDEVPVEASPDTEAEATEHGDETVVAARDDLPDFLMRDFGTPAKDSDNVAPDDDTPASGGIGDERPAEDLLDLGNWAAEPLQNGVPGASVVTDRQAPEQSGDDAGLNELEARIARFEDMVAQQDEEWEPDGTPGNDSGPASLLSWRDGGDAAGETAEEAGDDTSAEAVGNGLDDTGGSGGEDGAVIDEEMLRDMVREMVRQELQGALGERITRNIRKLVRKEIRRVMMSQDVE